MMYCTINDVVGTRLLQSVLMLQAILEEETAVQNVNPRPDHELQPPPNHEPQPPPNREPQPPPNREPPARGNVRRGRRGRGRSCGRGGRGQGRPVNIVIK